MIKTFHKAALISFLAVTACATPEVKEPKSASLQHQFGDVLDLKNAPDSASHYGLSSFSDMGAWHSFALPENGNAGTFPGPFLMTQDNGSWLSKGLTYLILGDTSTHTGMVSAVGTDLKIAYYPGKLWQSFNLMEAEIEMELIFVSDRTSLIKTKVTNRAEIARYLTAEWFGISEQAFEEKYGKDYIIISLKKGFAKITFDRPIQNIGFKNVDSKTSYNALTGQIMHLKPSESDEQHITISVYFDEKEALQDQVNIDKALADPDKFFKANEIRWNGYLEKVTDLKYPEYEVVAVKALNTLMNNWRSPAGDLHYNGLFPSYAYRGFHGVWSWDSWKHAVALARFAPELAKEQLRVMYDYQDEMGMIADVIYYDKSENNWRDTKPPLSVWAIWKIYEATEDVAFLEEMYERALKYHYWWYEYRDHDGNGLCEYGSTDGTRIAAAWESGMDNAVRFDDAIMLKNNDNGWSLNQESADLNAYLYAEKGFLINIAQVLGKADMVSELEGEAEQLKELVQEHFYSKEKGYFYDKVISSTELKEVEGTEGWTPLWAGIATQQQADAVFKVMLDTAKFDTFVPLPTFTKDHPKFNPRRGYWRGPVWLDQVYFGLQSLEAYGQKEEAERLLHKLINNAQGLKEKGQPIHENYHPVTGEGLNARHFSWSSAHLLLMLLND